MSNTDVLMFFQSNSGAAVRYFVPSILKIHSQQFYSRVSTMEAYSGDVTIRFRVRAKDHKESYILVTGDISELGKRNPNNALRLRSVGDGFYEGSIKLTRPKKPEYNIHYKYIPSYHAALEGELWDRPLRILAGQKIIVNIDEYGCFSSYTPQLLGKLVKKKKPLQGKLPKDALLVQFVVFAPLKHPTERVVIFGNNNFLGNWDAQKGKSMTYTGLKWELDCFVPLSNFPLEYKYAIDRNGKVVDTSAKNKTISLADLAEKFDGKVQTAAGVSVKITEDFNSQNGENFPLSQLGTYSDDSHVAIDHNKIYVDTRTGQLTAVDSFYAQLALNSGKECVITDRSLTPHDLLDDDLVHEQLCKSLMNPRTQVESLWLTPAYFANISEKRIALLNQVLENNRQISTLCLSFDSCCQHEDPSQTAFIYQSLSSGKFPFITSAFFYGCNFQNLLPIMEILKNNKILTKVVFHECFGPNDYFGDHVVDELQTNTTLTSASLGSISKNGLETLRKVLTTNQTLTAVQFIVEKEDLQAFGETLKNNMTLKKLTVTSWNENISWLFPALKANKTLQEFSLNLDNAFVFSAQLHSEDMHELFRHNMTLTKLQIRTRPQFEYDVHEYLSRNKHIHVTVHNNLIVPLFNIARQSEFSLQLLPLETWLQIAAHIPGRAYDTILRALFDDCTVRKVC